MSDETELFDVDVWDWRGDVIAHEQDVTADRVDEMREAYEPEYSVVVTSQYDRPRIF